MDTVAAELMEWEELYLGDLEILARVARSEECRTQDPLTEQARPQIQESAPASAEHTHRLRGALAVTPKGHPLRRIAP